MNGESLQKRLASLSMEPMRAFLILAVLAGCSGGDDGPVDAAPDAEPDAAVVVLDCPSYCTEVQTNCTAANAQYPDMAHCMATCGSFTVGTSQVTDTSGNTLGCRIYHGGAPAKTAPATHCPHAGPGGDQITATPPAVCSGGDVCATFCALEIKACGSVDSPLPGNPRDSTNNPLFQYQNMANCMSVCTGYDKTHVYSTTSAGNSLACRLRHSTTAAISVANAMTECPYTGMPPTGPCAGTPTP
jgi:hypothetical protein